MCHSSSARRDDGRRNRRLLRLAAPGEAAHVPRSRRAGLLSQTTCTRTATPTRAITSPMLMTLRNGSHAGVGTTSPSCDRIGWASTPELLKFFCSVGTRGRKSPGGSGQGAAVQRDDEAVEKSAEGDDQQARQLPVPPDDDADERVRTQVQADQDRMRPALQDAGDRRPGSAARRRRATSRGCGSGRAARRGRPRAARSPGSRRP